MEQALGSGPGTAFVCTCVQEQWDSNRAYWFPESFPVDWHLASDNFLQDTLTDDVLHLGTGSVGSHVGLAQETGLEGDQAERILGVDRQDNLDSLQTCGLAPKAFRLECQVPLEVRWEVPV